MLKKIKEELKLGAYEISQLETFHEQILQEAYKVLKLTPGITNPFKFLLGCCKKIQERKTAHVAPVVKSEPVPQPDWVKDYKQAEEVQLDEEELKQEQATLEKKIKAYKSSIEQAKKNFANSSQTTTADLRYLEQYLKNLHKAQQRYEKICNLLNRQPEPIPEFSQKTETVIDIANGIAVFMDQGRLESLSKVISITTATQMRDKSLLNWLRRNFIYNHDDVNHQLALKVVNRYRAQFNLPPRTFEISNLASDKQNSDKDIIDNKKDSMVVENKEVYEW